MKQTYTAKVLIGGLLHTLSVEASSDVEAFNQAGIDAACKFQNASIMVLKVERDTIEMEDFFNGIFK